MPVSATVVAQTAAGNVGRYPYVFGGIPAQGRVDCSSFVNMIIGWRLGMAIPTYGVGKYRGQSHGPVVIQWATWGTGSSRVSSPQPGDLCIWAGVGATGHIGIYVGAGAMVSALNPSLGIRKTPVAGNGPAGVPFLYRRLSAAELAPGIAWTTATGAAAGAASCGTGAAMGGHPLASWAACVALGAAAGGAAAIARRRKARRAGRELGETIAAAALEWCA